MNQRALKVLEYHKILEMLAACATGEKVRQLIYKVQPLDGLDEAMAALQETDETLQLLLKYANPPHCGISDQESSIKRAITGGVLSPAELLRIAGILRVSRLYREYGEEMEQFPIINGYLQDIYPYPDVENEINRCILSEEEIADSASPELSSIRRSIKNLNGKIRDTLNSYITSGKYSKYLQEQIVTTRGGRYVVPVKAEHKGDVPGLVHDTSSTGATLFIEPVAVVEANNKLREEENNEKREIERILGALSQEVAEHGESILENIRLLVKVDFAFSKGKLALQMNAVMPRLNDEGRIDIRKARHPLIDKSKVVPVDIKLGRDYDTLVITGPNTGGKTVTLKTTGLLCLMAQSGLHIPAADQSEVSVFDEVFADIGDEQSIEQSLSTFSSHMTNIVGITSQVSIGSLVLFDELGAGTDPVEGAALAMAILEEVRKKGAKTVATTHYSELKLYAMTNQRVENASCEFDVETLRPTYRLVIGVPGKSNAFAISQKLGLRQEILDAAEQYLSKENIQFEDVLSELEQNRQNAMKDRENALRLEEEAAKLRESVHRERKKIEEERQKMMDQAEAKAKEIIDKAARETEEMLAEIQKLRKEQKEQEAIKALEQVRKELKGKSDQMERRSFQRPQAPGQVPKQLIPGTPVYVIDTDTNGTVVNKPDKKGNVLVQTGILKITVPVSSLRTVAENNGEQVARKYAVSRDFTAKAQTICPQLDVRGMYAQEAVDKVDKFIDDAVVANLKEITVVHGKGTGALKNAIHNMLRSHSYVEDYRLGVYGEGDHGVTVIKLK